jgi:hypothetical protein
MRSPDLVLAGFLLTTAVLAAGCNGDDLSGPATGTLEVITVTGGDHTDPDGYTVQVDDGQLTPIGASTALEVAKLVTGTHTVTLQGLASGCTVAGNNPQTVSIGTGNRGTVTFQVTCWSLRNAIEITTAATGESLDPNGFAIVVDGGAAHLIDTGGTVTLQGFAEGAHTVTLTDVAPNCTPTEGSSQTVTVRPDAPAAVRFTLACSFIGITIWRRIPFPPTGTPVIDWTGGRTLWGTSPSDLFVVGRTPEPRGGIWHYDGSGWTEHVIGIDSQVSGIWGFSSTDVYAVGVGLGEDEQPGIVLHYDGFNWDVVPGPVPDKFGVFTQISGIWGAGPQDVFVSGSSLDLSNTFDPGQEVGLLGHFDGHSWSRMATPHFGSATFLTNMAGTSATDVWAIGSRATCEDCNHLTAMIVHYNGQEWTESYSRNADTYAAIWATAPNDVWVVGENDEQNAIVLHFDGAGWSRGEPLSSPVYGLSDVWASSSSDVYAVRDQALLHYNGTSWSKISDVGGNRVWGLSRNDVFILQPDAILHGSP